MDPQIPWYSDPRTYLRSLAGALRHRKQFAEVETCCLFFGYPRSGHSLVGSLLNAHRHVVIAHELDLFRFVGQGFGEGQLYALVLEQEQWFHTRGREWTGYDYTVPNQWQGRFEKLRVIGDKKGGDTTRRLREQPELLDKLDRTVKRPARWVHVVRNPFDNITTIATRNARNQSLEKAANRYLGFCETNAALTERVGRDNVHVVRHEQLIADPKGTLSGLCGFLGLDSPEEYLTDCAGILFEQPRKTRHKLEWTDALKGEVQSRIEAFDFLAGYTFDS